MRSKSSIVAHIIIVIGLIALAALVILPLTGNRTIVDTVYSYDYAYIELPNGTVVEGKVDNWCDYEGEQLQVTIDGTTYLCHSENVTLISYQ